MLLSYLCRRELTIKQGNINCLNAEAQRTQKIAEVLLILPWDLRSSAREAHSASFAYLCLPLR
jgi:hypothetical protein